ncbi:Peroxin-3 [Lipomyces chichibuensis]|uniref:Peroxin-3 n=1 Tax=Lipomyces chichibuensis TaxID=1546026 RepID=UPI00334323CD
MPSLTSFLHRHRRKFATAIGVAVTSYYAYRQVKLKFFEIGSQLSANLTSRENLRRRFEQNQQDASYTVAALLSSITDPIVCELPVEEVTDELQAKRGPHSQSSDAPSQSGGDDTNAETTSIASSSTITIIDVDTEAQQPKRTKKKLWNDLKIMAITRAVSLVYAIALLIFFTRLQLNMLGRQNYVKSVKAMTESYDHAADPDQRASEDQVIQNEVNRRFLTFSWWLLTRGWVRIVSNVREATETVFESVTPRTELGFDDLGGLIKRVRELVDAKNNNYVEILLPTNKEGEEFVLSNNPCSEQEFQSSSTKEQAIEPLLRALLDESTDLIESPNAKGVISGLVTQGFKLLLNSLQIKYFFLVYGGVQDEHDSRQKIVEFEEEKKVRLANILAGIVQQSHEMVVVNENANPYLSAMNCLPELRNFSAIVYSNFASDWKSMTD